jgi:serine protease
MNFKIVLISFAVLATHFSANGSGDPAVKEFRLPAGTTKADLVAGTLIVKLKPEYRQFSRVNSVAVPSLNRVLNTIGAISINKKFPSKQQPAAERNSFGQKLVDLSLIYEIKYSSNQSVEKIVNSILRTGVVAYAEPKYLPRLCYTPNDPNLGLQYYLTKIQAQAAWDISKGDTNVVIGITDTGTDINHPDLEPNIKYNYNDPIDGIDNDADGYVDNFRGWDLGENDNNPNVNASTHGSHVSGCAAATSDNAIGVASPGFNCKFLAVKIADATGALTEAYEGITYAADAGCQIINCSWGGGGGGSFGQDVIDYATINKNALVVAAAGNDNNEIAFFPASYNYVLSVGSTTNSDAKSSFSNYGAFLDVCAPGSNIYTAMSDNTYGYMSGTSMASPITAGCAAVVLSQNPTFNALQIGEQLRVTSDNIYTVPSNGVYQNKLGKGRVNLFRALTEVSPSVRMTNLVTTDLNDDTFIIGDTIRLTGDITNFLAPTANLDITLTTSSPYVTILDNNTVVGVLGTMATVNNNTDPFTIKVNPGTPQNTVVSLKLNFADGAYSDFQLLEITVNVDYINVTINQVSTTITSKGRLCFNGDGQTEGLGFQYAGSNLVYEAGMMVGQSATKVSDNVRGAPTINNDFQSMQVVQRLIPSVQSEFDLFGKFNDAAAPTPIPVQVTHKAFAWSTPGNDKFIIVEYNIKNSGVSSLSNVWAGIFADWDIQDYTLNKADENAALKMGYVYNTQPAGLWAGIKLLTATPFNHYAVDNVAGIGGVNLSDGYDDSEKYTTLSTPRPAAGVNGGGNDVIDIVSTGNFTLAAGDSVIVAFALIAGDDLNDINSSAVNAQIKYDELTGIDELVSTSGILTAYPNPVNDVININTAGNNIQSIQITDITGRVLVSENILPVKSNILSYNVQHFPAGSYLIKLSTAKETLVSKFVKK